MSNRRNTRDAGACLRPRDPDSAACEIGLDALHPDQSAIGVIEVEERTKRVAPGADFIALTRKCADRVVATMIGRFAGPPTF